MWLCIVSLHYIVLGRMKEKKHKMNKRRNCRHMVTSMICCAKLGYAWNVELERFPSERNPSTTLCLIQYC